MSHDDLPATVGLVKETRGELLSRMDGLDHRMDGLDHRMDGLDHRMDGLDHRMDALDHKMDALNHKMGEMEQRWEVRFHSLETISHRTLMVVEEMRGENRIVLDALKNVIERQDRQEAETAQLRKDFQSLR